MTKQVEAAFFNVGDMITYGKYLNKKAIIKGFTTDEKGYPAVEIEPYPKGSKQNKTLTLFKIRKVTPTEVPNMKLASKIAQRYRTAFGGWVTVVGKIRIQRWQDHIRVWDLTNAGKRGKTVDGITIANRQHLGFAEEGAWIGRIYESLQNLDTLGEAKAFIKDLEDDFPGDIRLEDFTTRGVDVQPKEAISLRLTTSTGVQITATPLDWSIVHTAIIKGPKNTEGFKQDTGYNPRRKTDIKPFYNWLLANTDKISKMTIQDFQKLWDDLGVKYDSH